MVAQDLQPEEYATVQLTPSRDGTLEVEAVMATCAQSPCHYAVAVYETPRPSAVPPRRPPGGDVRVNPRPRPRP
ncbi:MAG TPA: hypothetical protein VGC13_12725 [Longimicrobium sp.]|uniref:hypothetical protein n=1 Tax=Longimicrobium sp. TaxID=2029185 RepID=UPI002EDB970F